MIGNFRIEGRPMAVLASGNLPEDGGLFAIDADGQVERIDWLAGTGLFVDGDRLIRGLYAPPAGEDSVGEILVFDDRGVVQYVRVDGLAACHDVKRDPRSGGFVAVSTGRNAILWIGADGRVTRTWKAEGEGDAWHLNSLVEHDGRLLISAFGRFPTHRGWAAEVGRSTGFLLDVESGEEVLSGLHCPHTPRFVDGFWLVCDSARSRLVAIDPATGSEARSIALRGWTRGLAIGDDVLFVGESAQRRTGGPDDFASVAAIRRSDWAFLGRTSLPCREVYDLAAVAPALLPGLRRGFATNPARSESIGQYALFRSAGVEPVRLWASGDPLPPEACRVRISAEVPGSILAESWVDLACSVENLGGAILVSTPPNPVNLAYRWLDQDGSAVIEGHRTPLPRALPPGDPAACRIALAAPTEPGDYVLRLTLVQEGVAWFDAIDPGNALDRPVRILPVVT